MYELCSSSECTVSYVPVVVQNVLTQELLRLHPIRWYTAKKFSAKETLLNKEKFDIFATFLKGQSHEKVLR
jgi:hypothetical protein